jgi:pimeloyl-ACP methyl ester carboxylesterase
MRTQINRLLRTIWSRLTLSIMLIVAVLAAAGGYDRYAISRLPLDYPAPGRFIALEAGRMHYRCIGRGEPTLVLIAGIGGGGLDWSQVMPSLAQHRRVCAFDRFGQDWSDPAPHPRVFSTAVDELHAALERLSIQEPILAGHSLGGALAQLYAARYPVAGVVLVDGLTADVAEPVVARLGSYQAFDPLAQLGLLRPLGRALVHPAYPTAVHDQMLAMRSGSAALMQISAEGALAAQSVPSELRRAEERLTMPLLVIAAGASDVPGLPAGAFQAAAAAFATRHLQAVYVVISGAPHYVQASHPAEVVSAIEHWLAGIT